MANLSKIIAFFFLLYHNQNHSLIYYFMRHIILKNEDIIRMVNSCINNDQNLIFIFINFYLKYIPIKCHSLCIKDYLKTIKIDQDYIH